MSNVSPFVAVMLDPAYIAARARRERATAALNAWNEINRQSEGYGDVAAILRHGDDTRAAWDEFVAAWEACRDCYMAFLADAQ